MHGLLLAAIIAGASAAPDPSAATGQDAAWQKTAETYLIESYLAAQQQTEARFPDFPLAGAAPLVGLEPERGQRDSSDSSTSRPATPRARPSAAAPGSGR